MTIEIEYTDGEIEIYDNVADFYETKNKYVISIVGSNFVSTINISDVKHYKKL